MPNSAEVTGMTDWREAWQDALFGTNGFYRGQDGPAAHFRTAAHAGADVLAAALIRLAGQHGCRRIIDVGAGRGELLSGFHRHHSPLDLHGVDLVERPAHLPVAIGWTTDLATLPDALLRDALVVCWEVLDTIPCPILHMRPGGAPRYVRVNRVTGAESLGGLTASADLAWCEQWWSDGDRIEVGLPRDEWWSALVRRSRAAGGGVLLAVDYAHRREGRPKTGSLTGYRRGRQVDPIPDGSCDITAHVAMDAVKAAGEAAGATTAHHTTQRDALRMLGTNKGVKINGERVSAHDYVRSLVTAGVEAELLDPDGLGGFEWLIQTT